MTVRRVLVAVLCAVALGACGAAHPGAAAVVEGRVIDLADVDRLLPAYCSYVRDGRAEDDGPVAISLGQLRRQAVFDLAAAEVMERVIRREQIDLKPGDWRLAPRQRAAVAADHPEHADEIVALIERMNRSLAAARVLVLRSMPADAPQLTEEQIAQLAAERVLAEMQEADLSIDPRFAITVEATRSGPGGSLSVPAPAPATGGLDELPPERGC